MTSLVRAAVAAGLSLCIAGCAGTGPSGPPAATVTPLRSRTIAADRLDAIAIGKSTRADVVAALGETQVIRFESGFEVWVYRFANDAPVRSAVARGAARGTPEKETASTTGEFVVLFAPSGIVSKTRIRPPGNGNLRVPGPEPAPGTP